MNDLQFSLLPSGSIAALLVVGWVIFFLRRPEQRRAAIPVLLFGFLASAALVLLLHLDLRLPWIAACTDCLARYAFYSYALTFFQAFGWFGGAAIVVLRLVRGRAVRHA